MSLSLFCNNDFDGNEPLSIKYHDIRVISEIGKKPTGVFFYYYLNETKYV